MIKATHAIIDCINVSRDICIDDELLSNVLENAVKITNSKLIAKNRYRFGHNSPDGCTVVLMLDESHMSAHTYADNGKIAFDIFISKPANICEKAVNYILEELKIETYKVEYINRFLQIVESNEHYLSSKTV